MENLKRIKNKHYIITALLVMTMTFVLLSKDMYFNLGNYYVLPGLVIVAIGCSLFFMKNIYVRIDQFFIISIFMYILFIVQSLGYQFDTLAAYFLFFIFLFMVSFVEFDRKTIDFIINMYIFSAIICSTVLFIQMKQPYTELNVFRYGIFFTAEDYFDVNFTAAYLLVPAMIALNKGIDGNKNQKLYVFSAFIIFLAILLTGSRGGILPFVAFALYKLFRGKKNRLVYIFLILIVVVISIYFLPEDIFQRLFQKSYVNTNQRRYQDWEYGIKAFFSRPWFGHGIYSGLKIVRDNFGVNITPHNTFLCMLMQFGIIGSIPQLLHLFYPIYFILKSKKKLNVFIIYSSFLFSIFMIEANLTLVMMIPLMIFYLIINNMKQSNEKDIGNYFA